VSFNYDAIFESVMRQVWSIATDDLGPLDSHIRFLYPHGTFNFETAKNGMWKHIESCRQAIRYTWESERSGDVASARSVISTSEWVYLLGFACARENVEAIGLRDCPGAILAQNFANQRGLNQRLIDVGVRPENIWAGSLCEIIDNGFLGDLPI
jgi:hypothetical protein